MKRLSLVMFAVLFIAASIGAARPDKIHLPLMAVPLATNTIEIATTPTFTPTGTATATTTPTQTPTVTATQPSQIQCSCASNIYNCPDFGTQPQAQACYNYCITQGVGDIHQLDADDDGVACETLPPGFIVVR